MYYSSESLSKNIPHLFPFPFFLTATMYKLEEALCISIYIQQIHLASLIAETPLVNRSSVPSRSSKSPMKWSRYAIKDTKTIFSLNAKAVLEKSPVLDWNIKYKSSSHYHSLSAKLNGNHFLCEVPNKVLAHLRFIFRSLCSLYFLNKTYLLKVDVLACSPHCDLQCVYS